jgi:hypothetical protein
MQARSGARKAAEILNDLLRAQVEAKSHAC